MSVRECCGGRVQPLELAPESHVKTMRPEIRSALLGPVSYRVLYLIVDITGARESVTDRPVSWMGMLPWTSLSRPVQAGPWVPLGPLPVYCSLLSKTCSAIASIKLSLVSSELIVPSPLTIW